MTSLARPESLTLSGWHNFDVFGITVLTGEACAYSQRLLCDVNDDGLALLSEFWGIPGLKLAPPMNTRVNGLPAVGSVMLAPDAWKDLARFAFFHSRALGWVESGSGELTGIYSKELLDRYVEHDYPVHRNYALTSDHPHVGSRNVHQMTGRVV